LNTLYPYASINFTGETSKKKGKKRILAQVSGAESTNDSNDSGSDITTYMSTLVLLFKMMKVMQS